MPGKLHKFDRLVPFSFQRRYCACIELVHATRFVAEKAFEFLRREVFCEEKICVMEKSVNAIHGGLLFHTEGWQKSYAGPMNSWSSGRYLRIGQIRLFL